MSKIIVTLKEPISDGLKMTNILSFDTMEMWQHEPVMVFKNVSECCDCPIPISNILGVAYEQIEEKLKPTFELGANSNT